MIAARASRLICQQCDGDINGNGEWGRGRRLLRGWTRIGRSHCRTATANQAVAPGDLHREVCPMELGRADCEAVIVPRTELLGRGYIVAC